MDSLSTPASEGSSCTYFGHDESDHLRGRQHRERFTGVVGHDDPGQAVLGEQAGGIEGVGVDGDDREVLGEFRGTHASENTSAGGRESSQ